MKSVANWWGIGAVCIGVQVGGAVLYFKRQLSLVSATEKNLNVEKGVQSANSINVRIAIYHPSHVIFRWHPTTLQSEKRKLCTIKTRRYVPKLSLHTFHILRLTFTWADSAEVTSFKRCFVVYRFTPVLSYVRQTRITQILGNSDGVGVQEVLCY
jgi:hypothetical protein